MSIIKELLDGKNREQIEKNICHTNEYNLGRCRAKIIKTGDVTKTDIMTPEGEINLLFRGEVLTNISAVASAESQGRYVVMQSYDYSGGEWKQGCWSTLFNLDILEPDERFVAKSELPENLDIEKTAARIKEKVELMESADSRVKETYQTADPFKIRSLLVVQA